VAFNSESCRIASQRRWAVVETWRWSFGLVSMFRRCVFCGLLVAFAMAAPAAAHTDGQPGCAEYPSADTRLPNGYPFDAHRAVALFRFHRQQEALRELDAGRAIVRGPWRWRLPPDNRDEFISELDELRNCLATAKPPALATLTVRVLGSAEDAANNMAPRAGARVYVEGLPVGRTAATAHSLPAYPRARSM
jgi:hypothetical protein